MIIRIMFCLCCLGVNFATKAICQGLTQEERDNLSITDDEIAKGNVKTMTLSFYNSEKYNPKDNGRLEWKKVLSFDDKNNLIKTIMYSPRGRIISKDTLLYDVEGKLKKYHSENNEYGSSTYVYFYDNLGTTKTTESFDDSVLKYSTIKKYDSQNRLVEDVVYNSDKTVRFKTINEYGSNGKVEKAISIDSTGKTTQFTEYKYDDRNNVVLTNIYDGAHILIRKDTDKYKYSKPGNILEKISTSSDGSENKKTFVYNKDNNVIQFTDEDTHGSDFPIKEKTTFSDFDSNKNWLKSVRHAFDDGMDMGYYILIREIEYK